MTSLSRAFLSCLLLAPSLAACAPNGATPAQVEPDAAAAPATDADQSTDAPRAMRVTTIADGLDHPWSVALLPDGGFLVTERPGHLRHISPDGDISDPIAGVPEVFAQGQGGLLDVALAPDFATTGRIYLTYAEPGPGATAGTAAGPGSA